MKIVIKEKKIAPIIKSLGFSVFIAAKNSEYVSSPPKIFVMIKLIAMCWAKNSNAKTGNTICIQSLPFILNDFLFRIDPKPSMRCAKREPYSRKSPTGFCHIGRK